MKMALWLAFVSIGCIAMWNAALGTAWDKSDIGFVFGIFWGALIVAVTS